MEIFGMGNKTNFVMNEQQTIDIINNSSNTSLKLKKDKFCDYDAEDDNYILEIKNRRKYYKEKSIEAVKLFKNFQTSKIINKVFIYAVTDAHGLWVFNISKSIDQIVSIPPKIFMMPRTTDFKTTNKIPKYNYVLNENLAKKVLYDQKLYPSKATPPLEKT